MRSSALAFVPLLPVAGIASGLTPPAVRWEILPSESLTGTPASVSQQAAAGPIGATVSNTAKPGLTQSGTTLVDLGETALHSEITHVLGAFFTAFCSPGPCGQSHGEWSDLVTITADGVPNGTTGSFTGRLNVVGSLEAEIPPGWNPASALVLSDYTAQVWVAGERRDEIAVSCFANLSPPCLLSLVFQRFHYPEDYPASPRKGIRIPGPFGRFEVGPYDFVFGTPFSLEVDGYAETSLTRGINESGTATVTTDLGLAWRGLVRVNDAAGLGGTELSLDTVHVTTASGSDWVTVVPEPTGAAGTGLGALALLARRRAAGRRTPPPL